MKFQYLLFILVTTTARSASMDWDNYHNYETITEFMRQVALNYSSIAKLEEIGFSYENRSILVLKIGTNLQNTSKPAVLIDANFHSNEWITPAVATYFIDQLVISNYSYFEPLLSSIDFYILPLLNPDGYDYTHKVDRLWRKNRRPDPSCADGAGNGKSGVNLNLNFDFHFDGGSRNTCDETYGGKFGFSEPETKALKDFIINAKNSGVNWTAYFSLHSYAQVWFLPWGYKTEVPEDNEELWSFARTGVAALTEIFGTPFGIETLSFDGTFAGTSIDWAKGSGIFKYSQGVEIRDQGEYGFLLPPDQIKPCGEETLAAIEACAKIILGNK